MSGALLSEAERARVTAAVSAAEAGTDAEIVTLVAPSSDGYRDVALHYGIAAMLLVPALFALWPGALARLVGGDGNGWASEPRLGDALLAVMLVEAAAFLAVRIMLGRLGARLALTPRGTKARRVRRRAVAYFKVAAEARTAGRVGVLLYLSAAERQAEMVVDEAVHRAVPQTAWGAAMAALVEEVRHGRAGEGMAAAVSAIGTILAGHFPKTADDVNELPDRVIEL